MRRLSYLLAGVPPYLVCPAGYARGLGFHLICGTRCETLPSTAGWIGRLLSGKPITHQLDVLGNVPLHAPALYFKPLVLLRRGGLPLTPLAAFGRLPPMSFSPFLAYQIMRKRFTTPTVSLLLCLRPLDGVSW